MKIHSANIRNFTVLQSAEFSFSSGVNVILGRNGTGKSHLLKLLYGLVKVLPSGLSEHHSQAFKREFAVKVSGLFRPDDNAIGRLVTRSVGRSSAAVSVMTDQGGIEFRLTSPGNLHLDRLEASTDSESPAVFIPSREVLAIYEGFVQAYESRQLAFDETYRDICVLLSGAALRGPRLDRANLLAAPLEEILGGRVRLIGNRFYLQSEGSNLEAHLMAEGLRKIASLAHLILNGSLLQNSILFWDEPEANLNPRLVTLIARMLQRLAADGVQIFVTTHDYLLASELSLASEFASLQEDDQRTDIRFFGLPSSPTGSIQSGASLADLSDNDLVAEFAAHYDRQTALTQRALFGDGVSLQEAMENTP